MTEDEINKKAEKHCNEVLCNTHEKCNEVIKCRDWRSRRAGFFCGYEQALKDFDKENAELKEEFEQAKKVKVVEHFEAYGQCRDSRRIAELEAQIEKMKRCEICKHYQCGSCNYHSNWVKDCKENGMKLFELKEIKEK